MPAFPKMENPFREIFLHRVTRSKGHDTEVIEGPVMETIEYGKSKGKISGVEYERQRSLKGASVQKSRKALPASAVNVMSKTERSTQSDVLTSQSSKFALDVEEIQIVSRDEKTTTISTQTVPARYIIVPTTELSLDAIKSQAGSAGITVDAVSTVRTEALTQPQEQSESDTSADRAERDNTLEVVHDLTSKTTRTDTTTIVATTLSNDLAKEGLADDACVPFSATGDKRSQSSSSGSSQSGSTGSVVDLHAQRMVMESVEPQYEETFPSQEELENVVEQQEVPSQLSEAVGFSTSRDVNKAKVETLENTTVVEEFFQKSAEREVKTFCEQYARDETERKGSGQSDDVDDRALEGMRVMYPRDPASASDEPEAVPSTEHVEIRHVSTQHIMQSLQKRMETLGYEFPMPAFGEDSSKAKEQHLDIVWTEQERSILEDAIHSSKDSEVTEVKPGEVKPKEVYEIDGRQFFTSANSVDVSFNKETKTKTEVKDVPLLTKVRLIAYMSDAERDLIKSLIEFCRIIETLGDQKTSGRTLDVIPEGLELTVQPGVNYSDCLPSPESRKHSQLHSPSSVEDSCAEKAFEDTLAVIEKTKQFVNDTDFTKLDTPAKPFQNGLRNCQTPSTDDDVQSAQCTRILESAQNEQDLSDSSDDAAASANVVRRVSVSGLYRDLIDVVMPLKTEKNVTHCLTMESSSVTEFTTEKRSKASNVIYETSFVGQRTNGAKPCDSTPVNDTDSVSTARKVVSTTAHGSQVLHVPRTSEHGQNMSSVAVSADESSASQILSTEPLRCVQRRGVHKAETPPHHIPKRTDMDVDLHAIIIQPSGVVKQETLTAVDRGSISAQKPELKPRDPSTVSHRAEQIAGDTVNTATGEMSTTRIALVDRQNRVKLQDQGADQVVVSPKKTPPPVPPRPARRPPPVPPRPASRDPNIKREPLQTVRPVSNGGSCETQDSYNKNKGKSNEKVFLVRSDGGNKYEVETTHRLSGDAHASAEAGRANTDAARRAVFSDIAIEKLALVGLTVEDSCQSESGTVANQYPQWDDGGGVAKMEDVKETSGEKNEFSILQPDVDTLSSSGTPSALSPDTNCNVQQTNFVSTPKETRFADMLYAELFACKIMQESMSEVEGYIHSKQNIRDRDERPEDNFSNGLSDYIPNEESEDKTKELTGTEQNQGHTRRWSKHTPETADNIDDKEQIAHTRDSEEKHEIQSSISQLLADTEQHKQSDDSTSQQLAEDKASKQLAEDSTSENLTEGRTLKTLTEGREFEQLTGDRKFEQLTEGQEI